MFSAVRPMTWRACRFFLLLSFLVINCSILRSEHLPVKIYTTADGLGRDQINRIVQDSHGFLWFCTGEGLSRFDGYKFTNYTTANGLPSNVVTDLLETRDGTYLIATASGLSVLNPRGTREFTSWRPSQQGAEEINVLLEDGQGGIWCGTIAGLYKLDRTNGECRFQFVDLGLRRENYDSWIVESLLEDRNGSLWVGTRGSGLCRLWPDGHTEHFTVAQGLPVDRITSLVEDRTGRVWVGTTTGLCRLVSDPKPQRPVVTDVLTIKDGLTDNWVSTVFTSKEGELLVGSKGFNQLVNVEETHPHFRGFTTAQGLSDDNIDAIAEDRDGNLWVGSLNGGAMKIARNGFNTFSHNDGLGEGEIGSLFQDRNGEICGFNRDRQGHVIIACFDGQRFESNRLKLQLSSRDLGWGWGQEALQDPAGGWWVPTGGGLYRFPVTSRFSQLGQVKPSTKYDSTQGLPTNEVFSLFQDSKGDIWIGSISLPLNGLSRLNPSDNSLYHFTEAEGLPSQNVLPTSYAEDHDGNLWVGFSMSGLARFRNGRFTFFNVADGVPESWIHTVFCDHSGRLWVSGGLSGVSRIDDPQADHPKFVAYTVAEGLSSNQVNCITEDQWGRLYFGTGRGLDRLDPTTGRIKHYTSADGLVRGRVRYAMRDRSGALWFANETEVSRLVPEPDRPQPEPPVLIAGLQVAGVARPISELGESEVGPLQLAAGQNQVSIDFVALEFDPGEVLRYQHWLEGADQDWSAPSDQRVINYENLAPGSYRFLVRAVTADGVMSRHPAMVAFTIPPPVWRRWWFVTLSVGLFGLLVYSAHHYRVARLLELERVRTRIATDLHDDIGSSLSRMAILSEVAKRRTEGSARESVKILTDIAESARNAVDSMSDIVWAIDPRRDDLSNVVFRVRQFASDLLGAKGITWQFQTPDGFERIKLNPEQRRHIFLIFKEAINNSVRHADCQTVTLSLEVAHHQIVGEIRDDGRGFVVPPAEQTPENGGGHGLVNLRARAALLGGQMQIDSSSEKGTCIRLSVPLKRGMA
jgi:ligand-binding sensor domain-containing protein/two-component sensor histidine kinase